MLPTTAAQFTMKSGRNGSRAAQVLRTSRRSQPVARLKTATVRPTASRRSRTLRPAKPVPPRMATRLAFVLMRWASSSIAELACQGEHPFTRPRLQRSCRYADVDRPGLGAAGDEGAGPHHGA